MSTNHPVSRLKKGLAAAQRTVPGGPIAVLAPTAPRGGDPDLPVNIEYAVDYRPFELRRGREFTRSANERGAAENVVMLLLTAGARITEIRCDGTKMSAIQFDRLLKAAAGRVAGGLLRASLALDAKQVEARFGFAN